MLRDDFPKVCKAYTRILAHGLTNPIPTLFAVPTFSASVHFDNEPRIAHDIFKAPLGGD
jgi:hypothetical protein